MDKIQEDINFFEWLFSLPEKEREPYLLKSDIIEGNNDPSFLDIDESKIDEWMKENKFRYGQEWIDMFNNI